MMRSLSTPTPTGETDSSDPTYLRFRFNSETVEQFADRYAADVSRGGIFIRSRRPSPVGTRLKLDLQLQNGAPVIVGEGTVFWTREPDASKPGSVPGMGIRFNKLTAASQQLIEQVLTQRSNRDRSGLFDALGDATVVGAVDDGGPEGGSRPNLPFSVFSGRKDGVPGADDAPELLANAGREETTPLVGVSAATLADSRPTRIEPPKSPASGTVTASPSASAPPAGSLGGEAHSASEGASDGVRRGPPALALIKPSNIIVDDKPVLARSSTGSMHKVPGLPIAKKRDASAPVVADKAPEGTPPLKIAAPRPPTPPVGMPAAAHAPMAAPGGGVPAAPIAKEPSAPATVMPAAPARELSGPTQAIRIRQPMTAQLPVSVKVPLFTKKKAAVSLSLVAVAAATIFATTRGSTPAPAPPAARPVVTVAATAASRPAAPAPAPVPAKRAAPAPEPVVEAAPSLEPAPVAEAEPVVAAAPAAPSRLADRDRRPVKGKTPVGKRTAETRSSGPAVATSDRTGDEVMPPAENPPAPPIPAPPAPPIARAEPARAEPARALAPTIPPPVHQVDHKLRMTSIPSEAEVILDGKVIGRTPLFGVSVDLDKSHTVVLRKEGYAPYQQSIGAGSEWSVRATENTATLRISAFMKKL
jgi:uncharacterized protein (TIGR02266 family)